MRIVHVLTRFLRAGTEENTAITCNGQAEAGHEVWVVYGREYDDRALRLLHPAVKQVRIDAIVHEPHLINDVVALLGLCKLFREVKADLVHTHQSKAGALGRLAAKLAGTPHVVHGVHILPFMNTTPAEALIYRTIEKLLGPWTDAFVHVTPALRSECIAAKIGREDQHFVVPSGMDVSAFKKATLPKDAHALLSPLPGFTRRPSIILLVSALEARKRHVPFLSVFKAVVDREPNTKLLLAGVGSEADAIQRSAAQLGLSHNVVLLGLRDDVDQLIKLADIGVLASEREGLARSVIQYALGGLPIVAPQLPGIDRVVREGQNGLLCPIDDLSSMEEPLCALLSDELLRRRMSRASTKIDLSDWAAERMVERIDEVYRQIGAAIQLGPRTAPAVAVGSM
jgi:glycosyltransferase involved in cell wall biosynthesis